MSSSVDKNELIWELEEVNDMEFVSDEDEEEEDENEEDGVEVFNDANFTFLGQQLAKELDDPFRDRKGNVPAKKHKIKNRLLLPPPPPPPKVTLPPILLSEDMSSDILDALYQSAIDKVTSSLSLNLNQDLKILKNAGKPNPLFLVFVPIGQDEKKSHLILRAKDLYRVGYEIEDHHYILDFKVESKVDDGHTELRCGKRIHRAMVDYPILEALAKKQRHQLQLGRKSLIQHFKMLSFKNWIKIFSWFLGLFFFSPKSFANLWDERSYLVLFFTWQRQKRRYRCQDTSTSCEFYNTVGPWLPSVFKWRFGV